MSEKKITIGQAIDQIVEALQSLEPAARTAALEAACSYLGVNSVIKEKFKRTRIDFYTSRNTT